MEHRKGVETNEQGPRKWWVELSIGGKAIIGIGVVALALVSFGDTAADILDSPERIQAVADSTLRANVKVDATAARLEALEPMVRANRDAQAEMLELLRSIDRRTCQMDAQTDADLRACAAR